MEIVMTNAPGKFNFGLSALQEERAAKLHSESIVFDMLSQYAGGNIFAHYSAALQKEFREQTAADRENPNYYWNVVFWPFEMSKQGKSDLLFDWFRASGLTCGCTSTIKVHDTRDSSAEKLANLTLSYRELPWVRYATKAEDIRRAKRDGAIAFYANCQPAAAAPRDLKAFDAAYGKGLRSFMLTYNRMDHIGVGCTERVDTGLSMFGVDVVKHCNDLGIIVDVSHCGHLTSMDACRQSRKPVTANHTAARGVHDHSRGKNDEALRAIAQTGGVVGVAAAPFFLTNEPMPTIEHMLDHVDYIAELVGWQHVAVGTDWPLQAPDDILEAVLGADLIKQLGFREGDRVDATQRLAGFDDCRDLPNITRGLVKRGYTDEQIRGVLGENALRVFEEVCG